MTSPTQDREDHDGVVPLDAKEFRRVVGHLASGVTVVTAAADDVMFGMTASSVTSLSADPPMMLACLNNAVPTAGAVSRSGRFSVNVLGAGQAELAHKFAVPSENKFAGVQVHSGTAGAPLISAALAHIECEVVERVVGGTHTAFFGRVLSASASDGEPLTYFRGGFGRFEFTRDDAAYRQARQKVLDRVWAPGDVVALEDLAASLDVDEAAAFYALTRLSSDGLVRRDPDAGYVITPFDARTSDATFDARLAIEIGVVDLVTSQPGGVDVTELRQRFDAMAQLLVDDRFVDFDAYLDANYLFHEALVALAGNNVLSAAFGGLSIKQVMTRSFGSTPITSQRFIEAQRRITTALEGGDRDAAESALRDYSSLAKDRARDILEQVGGRL
ncbi:flavin reductase [Aeromicrobium sp. CFBP 8757]|uniref:flavin reductase n=1 Tax=Aeromicrobium sp. CFBP 8757 TaxID=2775288 RepID=UPI001782007D|nr:flavin reductase [Aeromicrobium sp. CFBP 8757]MBD8605546.1 flavin reductase [Aeromicrobium sp. CFBP 8757]